MPEAAAITKIYRILTWVSLIGLIVVMILVLRKSPPPDLPYDASAAERVERKLAAADQAKTAGQPATVQIERTELNSYLAQNLELEGTPSATASSRPVPPTESVTNRTPAAIPDGSALNEPLAGLANSDPQTVEQIQSSVKDVKVDMDGDLVKAYVIFDFHGKDLSLELDGHLSTQNGYLKFDPVGGKLGSLPLPQSTLESAVAKLMSSPENREKLKLPDDISDIQIVDGKAVLSYK